MEKTIKDILDRLEDNGFPSYLVGGYVRDALLGIESYDIDICTKALPKDIHKIFSSTNNNYGSINLSIGKFNVDITTFRKDYDYIDRHPSKVEYINSLEEDLKRRDFTVNAICMDKDGKIIDPLNGVEDLNNKILRVIGDTDAKLKEDPLRMLRAIRFASTKNFVLDSDLLNGIKNNVNLIKTLSNYRIREELDKILLNKNFLNAFALMDKTKISDVIGLEYKNVVFVDDLLGMWSQIKVNNMSFTNNEKSNIIKITEVVDYGIIDSKMLFKHGLYVCTIAGKILNINPTLISEMFNKMPLKSREDLNISGSELKSIVGSGKIIGDTIDLLINLILDGKLNNKKEDIIKFLKKG